MGELPADGLPYRQWQQASCNVGCHAGGAGSLGSALGGILSKNAIPYVRRRNPLMPCECPAEWRTAALLEDSSAHAMLAWIWEMFRALRGAG